MQMLFLVGVSFLSLRVCKQSLTDTQRDVYVQ